MMSFLLFVLIAWVTFGLLFVGLGLLIVEHFSNTPTIADESISEAATQMAKLDRAMDEPVQKPCELADTCDVLARSEDTISLAPRDAIPTAQSTVADRIQRTGAVIIRDPRLTRARTLGDQSAGLRKLSPGPQQHSGS
jgi:hypothetical protein